MKSTSTRGTPSHLRSVYLRTVYCVPFCIFKILNIQNIQMPTYYTKSHSTFAHCSSCTRKLQDESCGAGLAPNKQESSQLSDAPSNTWLSARAKRSCSCRTHGAVLLLPACPPSACFLHTCCACDFAPMLLLL